MQYWFQNIFMSIVRLSVLTTCKVTKHIWFQYFLAQRRLERIPPFRCMQMQQNLHVLVFALDQPMGADFLTPFNFSDCVQAPVPQSIFRSNSKFDENSKYSSVKYTRPITPIFCTRHDSVTVVTCAKHRCDRSSIFETRAFWIFI